MLELLCEASGARCRACVIWEGLLMAIHKRVKDSHKAPKRTIKFRRSRIAISYPLLEAKRKWPARFAKFAFDAKADIGGLRNPGAFQCDKLSRNDALS